MLSIGDNARQHRAVEDRVENRLEVSGDAAIEPVVIETLVVRLVWLDRDHALGIGAQGCVATAAVAPTVSHVAVEDQLVPACGKCWPVRIPVGVQLRQCGAQRCARHEAEACVMQLLDEHRGRRRHGCGGGRSWGGHGLMRSGYGRTGHCELPSDRFVANASRFGAVFAQALDLVGLVLLIVASEEGPLAVALRRKNMRGNAV